jgi:hypothetical protein
METNVVSRIVRGRAATVGAIVRSDKFIPAQRIAPRAFVTCGAVTHAIAARAEVKAGNVIALVFFAGDITNGGKHGCDQQ